MEKHRLRSHVFKGWVEKGDLPNLMMKEQEEG